MVLEDDFVDDDDDDDDEDDDDEEEDEDELLKEPNGDRAWGMFTLENSDCLSFGLLEPCVLTCCLSLFNAACMPFGILISPKFFADVTGWAALGTFPAIRGVMLMVGRNSDEG